MKIQSFKQLFVEMRMVARGEIPPPRDAAMPSVEPAAQPHTLSQKRPNFEAFDRIMRREGGEKPRPDDILE